MNTRILNAILKHLSPQESFDQKGIQTYRSFLETSAKAFKPDKNVAFKPFDIQNTAAAWIVPEDVSSDRTILYLHGGGFIAGSINSHRDLASRIAKASSASLLIIDYRLAPEHPFPAGLNDALNAYKHLLQNSAANRQIILAGDSAGGGLALSLLVKLKAEKLPLPWAGVFLSPWIDLENKNLSIVKNKNKDPMLTKTMLDKTARLYTQGDLSDPLVSPVNADISGLCPMLIHAGENEILLDDSLILARKAGATAKIEVWENMFHVFQYFARYLPAARRAIKNIGRFINNPG